MSKGPKEWIEMETDQTKKFNFQSVHFRSGDAAQFRIISILIKFIVKHFRGEEDAE
jgi:hypothetical protein